MHNGFHIERLGAAEISSPINLGTEPGDLLADFTPDDARVLAEVDLEHLRSHLRGNEDPESMELAGPRERIYFDPSKLTAGIVTCGGLCPGLNNVIRGLTMTLHHGYRVKRILGFRYGYKGLTPDATHQPIELTPDAVKDIHGRGGTVLGSSRGPQDAGVIVENLERLGVRLLFTVGGDGTFRGALKLHQEIARRGADIAVVAVPKTIDNDIPHVDRTFGFQTAVSKAAEAIMAAYYEAQSAENGIGLVKLMGRHAGFIAANAALAARIANLVLVPELPFDLDGRGGLFAYLEDRFAKRKSTVIVVAEGAGQRHLELAGGKDASGNVKLGDIGVFIKQAIADHFKGKAELTLKYIDPSYIIRSAPAGSNDAVFCGYLAQNAAHAGMSGRTGMAVGRSHGKFTHIPLERLVESSKKIDPEGSLWISVLESTGQPFYMTERPPKDLSRQSLIPQG